MTIYQYTANQPSVPDAAAAAAACDSDLLDDSSILLPFLQLRRLMEEDGLVDTPLSLGVTHLEEEALDVEGRGLPEAEAGREGRDWVTTLP